MATHFQRKGNAVVAKFAELCDAVEAGDAANGAPHSVAIDFLFDGVKGARTNHMQGMKAAGRTATFVRVCREHGVGGDDSAEVGFKLLPKLRQAFVAGQVVGRIKAAEFFNDPHGATVVDIARPQAAVSGRAKASSSSSSSSAAAAAAAAAAGSGGGDGDGDDDDDGAGSGGGGGGAPLVGAAARRRAAQKRALAAAGGGKAEEGADGDDGGAAAGAAGAAGGAKRHKAVGGVLDVPSKMTVSALKAELQTVGVNVTDGKRSDYVTAVEYLRAHPQPDFEEQVLAGKLFSGFFTPSTQAMLSAHGGCLAQPPAVPWRVGVTLANAQIAATAPNHPTHFYTQSGYPQDWSRDGGALARQPIRTVDVATAQAVDELLPVVYVKSLRDYTAETAERTPFVTELLDAIAIGEKNAAEAQAVCKEQGPVQNRDDPKDEELERRVRALWPRAADQD